ncbi:hypothetical protein CFP56_032370 [Quercus suber]|uniref:Uncharacterized protein n=1 Tax=Quercus suber TaxID=58331 RepID=A0AAW0JHC0_QUESU
MSSHSTVKSTTLKDSCFCAVEWKIRKTCKLDFVSFLFVPISLDEFCNSNVDIIEVLCPQLDTTTYSTYLQRSIPTNMQEKSKAKA